MAWQIEYSAQASGFLERLERRDALRIMEKLEQTAENPHHFAQRLTGAEDYKIRIGDYRVIVLLEEVKKLIFVERIGHRKNIYKE